jgi:hypothetical protein
MDDSYRVPRSWILHDRGGFFFLLRLPRGGDGRFLPIPVVIVVVGGGYLPPRVGLYAESS